MAKSINRDSRTVEMQIDASGISIIKHQEVLIDEYIEGFEDVIVRSWKRLTQKNVDKAIAWMIDYSEEFDIELASNNGFAWESQGEEEELNELREYASEKCLTI